MPSFTYSSFWDDVTKGSIDIDTDAFRVMLLTAAGVSAASKTTHLKRSSVTGEITATGYTAGGAVTNASSTKDTANNRQVIRFAGVNWPSFTGTARGCVIYKARGGASSADELCLLNDFGSDVTITGNTMTVADTTAIITIP